jgi:hypothetical protein
MIKIVVLKIIVDIKENYKVSSPVGICNDIHFHNNYFLMQLVLILFLSCCLLHQKTPTILPGSIVINPIHENN